MDKFLEVLIFMMGMSAGMDALSLKIGTNEMTVFTFLLMVTVITKLNANTKIYLRRRDKALTIYFAITIISSMISFVNVPKEWYRSNIVNLISTVFGIIGFWLLFNDNNLKTSAEIFLKGFKINCMIQIFWALMQFIMCQFFQLSLNSFCGLKKARESLTLAEQVSGLGWERASLCLTLVYAIILYNNIWIKLVSVFIAVMCQSRSGLILILIVIFVSMDWRKLKHLNSNKILKAILFAVAVSVLIAVNFELFYKMIVSTYMRFTNLEKEASALGHMSYYQQFPTIITKCYWYQILFGFGGASSGYPYTKFYNRFLNIEGGWSVESSWLGIFWASGLIGFILFLHWFFNKMIYFRHNKVIFALLVGIFIGGMGYTLLPTWSVLTLIFILRMSEEQEKVLLHYLKRTMKS